MNLSSTRHWLIAVLAALGMLTATGAYAQDTTTLTVTSVGYYADEAMTIAVTEMPLNEDARLYMVIQFSENVNNTVTTFFPLVPGQPGLGAQYLSNRQTLRIFSLNILEPGTVFTTEGCRAKSDSDTSEYLCLLFLDPIFGFTPGPLRARVLEGASSLDGDKLLAEEYIDSTGITLVATPDPPTVTSVSHYSDAGRTTTISDTDTVTGGAVYSVIQFTGWIIDTELADSPPATRPQIFYQIDMDQRVQFGGHATTGTPQDGTCALLDGGDGTVAANQSFWCRYNTRSGNTGTYQIIVGTDTTDLIGQPAAEYTDNTVSLDVMVGLATLSIADVSVNEGDGTATVTVTVNEEVSGGFIVDAITTDDSATAGEDYTATTKTLNFDGNASETKTFSVPIIDDAIYDGGVTETVKVSLANLVLMIPGTTNVDYSDTALIRITDNDYEVVLTMEDIRVSEGDSTATVTVRLNAAVPNNFSVDISTTDGNAFAGEDYTVTNRTLPFNGTIGEEQTFNVPIINDDTPEFQETLTVSLGNLQAPTDTTTTVGILRPAAATITIRDDDLDDDSINLNLIFPVTVNGKTYYWLDNSGNGTAEINLATGITDRVTHNALDNLLNNGSDTVDTQPGGHDGSDDQRSVIVGDTILILPTQEEFRALRSALSDTSPAGWPSATDYWTSTPSGGEHHFDYNLVANTFFSNRRPDSALRATIFQVLSTTLTFGTSTIPDQFYNVGRTVNVTLPAAIGGFGDLSYTLTGDIPDGLSFTTATRTLRGRPTTETATVNLTYRVTDSDTPTPSSATLTFRVTVLSGEFITTWRIEPGSVANRTITIPIHEDSSYRYTVDWGDDLEDTTTYTSSTIGATHTYTNVATTDYQVAITGVFPRIYFNNDVPENLAKIISIDQWGNNRWDSMESAFEGNTNLGYTAKDTPDLSQVTDMSSMFINAQAFNGDIGGWDVSNVTNMESMFQGTNVFNGDISEWDVGNVINMESMFRFASDFNQNIGGWDVGKVTNMVDMFNRAGVFNQDISEWDVSQVTTMEDMFENASVFDQNIGGWKVGNVRNMETMFVGATAFDQDIGGWDVSQVTTMAGMFNGALAFDQDIGGWDVSQVTTMASMFNGASAFDQDIGDWKVSQVNTMANMFNGVTLSIDNYDALLAGWSMLELRSGIPFSAGESQYCNQLARNVLTDPPNSWRITDEGSHPSCPLLFDTSTISTPNSIYTFTIGTTVSVTLPPAYGGLAPLEYTLEPIPDGLDFTTTTLTLAGVPTTETAAVTLTYTVTDSTEPTATTKVLTFMVRVTAAVFFKIKVFLEGAQ